LTGFEKRSLYDVIKNFKRPSQRLIDALSNVPESATINESIPNKDGALDYRIKPIWPGLRVCGSALTVQCGPGDNIMLHKAISIAHPGDVIVVVNQNYVEVGGVFGGLMAASCKVKGVAGLVTDGSCRDTMAIKEMNFPVFSRGVSIKPSTKLLPGKINHPIIIGGVLVKPGDIVFGDNDGVVVIPQEIAEEVLVAAEKRMKNEDSIAKRILDGEGIVFTFGGFEKLYESLRLNEE
jgi:4-hydroxy-4-methyl-2-oxoglutarate aldolase